MPFLKSCVTQEKLYTWLTHPDKKQKEKNLAALESALAQVAPSFDSIFAAIEAVQPKSWKETLSDGLSTFRAQSWSQTAWTGLSALNGALPEPIHSTVTTFKDMAARVKHATEEAVAGMDETDFLPTGRH